MTLLVNRLHINDMGLSLRRFLLLLLALQVSVVPVLPTCAAQGRSSSEIDREIFQTGNVSINAAGSRMAQELCDEEHGINGRCASCFCVKAGVFSPEPDLKPVSNLVVLPNMLGLTLFHIYYSPPFRPPIS